MRGNIGLFSQRQLYIYWSSTFGSKLDFDEFFCLGISRAARSCIDCVSIARPIVIWSIAHLVASWLLRNSTFWVLQGQQVPTWTIFESLLYSHLICSTFGSELAFERFYFLSITMATSSCIDNFAIASSTVISSSTFGSELAFERFYSCLLQGQHVPAWTISQKSAR